jgi:hypothetical protein
MSVLDTPHLPIAPTTPTHDPYREYWFELRRTTIIQVRLLRGLADQTPAAARGFHAELERNLVATVRTVERWTGCKAWSGA